ncbi:CDP-glycerol glycerophosphotransferase family protein [Bacillus spongiae]|uniref:CDP-glycerol glycerophosphotransferase family protein n=1 Tax=Bacillus spongiae TaxID=2683610 RepID=A0ABU8HGC2_9BACI
MNTKMRNFLKKISLKHTLKNIIIDDENHLLKLFFKDLNFLFKKELLVRDRSSGRRIHIPLKNNTCFIPLQELSELTDDGNLDFYFIGYIAGRSLKKRIAFNTNLKQAQFIDESTKREYKIRKTVKNNLTIHSTKTSFKQKVQELKVIGNNFYLNGSIEDLDNKKPESAEIIFKRRDTNKFVGFTLEFNKGMAKGRFNYSGIVYLDKFNSALVVNSRWDAFLQLRNIKNEVVYRKPINLQSYSDFKNEEDRFLLNIPNTDEFLTSLYATMGLNSLALWYTDKIQFDKTYQIAKGKTVFNETADNEPLDNKMVFFESFFGKNYSGNPKYVYEELIGNPNFKDYTFVWSYSGLNPDDIPGSPVIVSRESEDYYRYLAKAKYWVSNIIFPVKRKREGNVYLQTWHGTPLKKLGFDIDIEGPETLARENFYIESRNWDYLIAANKYSSEIFERAFKYNKEILEYGYPANDLFYQEKNEIIQTTEEIKAKLGIPSNKKVVLYAPTWRDDEMAGSWEHTFELKFDIDNFYNKLGDDYVLVLRMHHLVGDALVIKDEHQSFIYDCSKYDDIQELYLIADLLITDYSSVFFDYVNSKKPVLFYAYDYEKYKDNIRGFYLDMEEELPGPVLKNGQELLDAILNIEEVKEKYHERYLTFYEKFCSIEDGNASKKVIEKVFKQ